MRNYSLLGLLAAIPLLIVAGGGKGDEYQLPSRPLACSAQQVTVGDSSTLRRFEFTEVHMGTEFRIVLYAPGEEPAKKAAQAAFARIAELDDIMSDYRKTSELMQLC